MAIPQVQVLYRRYGDILFGWSPLSNLEAKSYNIYASPSPSGIYSLIKSGIPNITDKTYKNRVCIYVKDTDVPIPTNKRYYFKVTAVDPSNVESDINLSDYTNVYPPTVNFHFEGEKQETNSHGYGWSETNQRWEKLLVNEEGKLAVDVVVGDITISDVKVAALSDNTTLQYMLVDSNRRLVVKDDPTSINRIRTFNKVTDVVKSVETVGLTYTNANTFYIDKIMCTGTSEAWFRVKIGVPTIASLRSSWNERNVIFDFTGNSVQCPAGSVVTVTVEHLETANQDFEISFFGYTA